MTIDYRALLVKYIDHVGECEGTTFIYDADPVPLGGEFTAEEYAALLECQEESRELMKQRQERQEAERRRAL